MSFIRTASVSDVGAKEYWDIGLHATVNALDMGTIDSLPESVRRGTISFDLVDPKRTERQVVGSRSMQTVSHASDVKTESCR